MTDQLAHTIRRLASNPATFPEVVAIILDRIDQATRDRERGAVLVEFALVASLLLFLVLGGITIGLWTVEVAMLQHTAQEITVAGLTQLEAATAAEDIGATLVCYDPAGACQPGTLDGLSVTLEKTASSYAPGLADLTLSRSAVAAPTEVGP